MRSTLPLLLVACLGSALMTAVSAADQQQQQQPQGLTCGKGHSFCGTCTAGGVGCATCIPGFTLEAVGRRGGLCLPTPTEDVWADSVEQGRLDFVLSKGQAEAQAREVQQQLSKIQTDLQGLVGKHKEGKPDLTSVIQQTLQLTTSLQGLHSQITQASVNVVEERARALLAAKRRQALAAGDGSGSSSQVGRKILRGK